MRLKDESHRLLENLALVIIAAHICYRLDMFEQIEEMQKFEFDGGG